MKTVDGNNGIKRHTHFDTLTELVDFAMAHKHCDEMHGYDNPEWTGGTIKQAHHLATHGWPEGTQKAMATAERLTNRIMEAHRIHLETEMTADVFGAAFDVGAITSGVPEAWVRPSITEVKRAISIAYSIDASGSISAEILANRGAAVMALVSILQVSGHPVSVTAFETDKAKNHCLTLTVLDANSGSVPDYDRIAFVLMHASMLRRFDQITVNAIIQPDFWGHQAPGDAIVSPEQYDIVLGAASFYDAKRWQNGGEDWILAEYERLSAKEA